MVHSVVGGPRPCWSGPDDPPSTPTLMRFHVESLQNQQESRVHFRCSSGQGLAFWRGEQVPAEGGEFDAELELPGRYAWNREISLADEESPTGFRQRSEADEVVGEVADFDADGTLTIRVGDSIAMLDTTDDPPLGIIGRKVAIRPHSIELYPYEL